MSLRSKHAVVGLSLALSLVGCSREECPTEVVEVRLDPVSFTWDDELQLGVFRPNGEKLVVSKRGAIPANAYHAVRVNLPNHPEKTPVPPPGLTWRVESALVDEPVAILQTELQLRKDAHMTHAGRWAADIVGVTARVAAEKAESSEISDGLTQRAETLKKALNAVSPSTGEEFEIPQMESDRKVRFMWAQRPTLADFALDNARELDRAIVLVSDCDACPQAQAWATERGVRVLGDDDPESAAARQFFAAVGAQPMKFPMLWTEGVMLYGFDSERWGATLPSSASTGEDDG